MASTPSRLAAVTRTAPLRIFKQITGYGHNKLYDLFHAGEVETVLTETGHRLVLLNSWEDYLTRLRTGQRRDPDAKAAAIAAFEASLGKTGAKNAARARRAIERKKDAVSAARGVESAVPVVLARPRS
jgi:hypothetical protein